MGSKGSLEHPKQQQKTKATRSQFSINNQGLKGITAYIRFQGYFKGLSQLEDIEREFIGSVLRGDRAPSPTTATSRGRQDSWTVGQIYQTHHLNQVKWMMKELCLIYLSNIFDIKTEWCFFFKTSHKWMKIKRNRLEEQPTTQRPPGPVHFMSVLAPFGPSAAHQMLVVAVGSCRRYASRVTGHTWTKSSYRVSIVEAGTIEII